MGKSTVHVHNNCLVNMREEKNSHLNTADGFYKVLSRRLRNKYTFYLNDGSASYLCTSV